MKVQYISYSGSYAKNNSPFADLGEITYSPLGNPHGFERFNISIVDIGHGDIWKSQSSERGSVNCLPDFVSLGSMMANDKESLVLVILPKNKRYVYHYSSHSGKYISSSPLKDNLPMLITIISRLSGDPIPLEFTAYMHAEIGLKAQSDFYIDSSTSYQDIYFAESSNKSVLVRKPGTHIYFTTINELDTEGINWLMVKAGEFEATSDAAPDWMAEVIMFDDEKQNEIISIELEKIKEAETSIEAAELKLQENAWYKSALYKADDDLVNVVVDILEELLELDLSAFVDEHKEDQRFEIDGITYIVEVKGVNSNVRRDYVSQLDNHVQGFIEESGKNEENVKGLLIINPMRNKPLSERSEIHDTPINLAVRNKSLIVTTETLLKLFEAKLQGQLSKDEMIKKMSKFGLLTV